MGQRITMHKTYTHTHTPHAHMQPNAVSLSHIHTHTHARARAHKHTHTHTKDVREEQGKLGRHLEYTVRAHTAPKVTKNFVRTDVFHRFGVPGDCEQTTVTFSHIRSLVLTLVHATCSPDYHGVT